MANEISLYGSLTWSRDGVTYTGSGSLAVSQVGTTAISNIQSIGTSSEALSLVDITAPGYLFVKNMDATNFVCLGTTNPCVAANAPVKLLPGEVALIPTRQASWYAIADTAAVNMLVLAASL